MSNVARVLEFYINLVKLSKSYKLHSLKDIYYRGYMN
jgi:hypothetical protein